MRSSAFTVNVDWSRFHVLHLNQFQITSAIIEPTEDWTIEQVWHRYRLRANAKSDAEFIKTKEDLSHQFEQGKKELWEAHEQVKEILNKDSTGDDENILMETEHGIEQTESEKSELTKPAASSSLKPESSDFITEIQNKKTNTIRVDIISGPYVGQSYDLKPQSRIRCWKLGRSQSKKFRISLPKDQEISTSHGRFEYSRGKFYYKYYGCSVHQWKSYS